MKKAFVILALVLQSAGLMAQFTAGRLVVLRVGRGLNTLTNASTATFLDEYSFTGTAGFSKQIDSTGASALTCSGTATSEGLISLTPDRTKIIVSGYNSATGTSGIASTTSATVARGVGYVTASGVYTLAALTSTNFSANNIRSGASDGTNYWASGGNSGIVGGTSNLNTVISTTLTNTRCLAIFSGQLFYSTGSGSNRGIYRVGSGLPTSTSQTATVYINTGSSSSNYGFAFNADTSICFIADDGAGISKYTRTGSSWSLAYVLTTIPCRALVVNWASSTPAIYAVTTSTATGGSQNAIIHLNDNGASSTADTVANAAPNTAFRGLAFTPGTNFLPVTWKSLTGKRSGKQIKLNWQTASETNNARFEIERSLDNISFESIGKVKGSGNSYQVANYQYTDNSEFNQTVYYRIRQVDFDGKSEVSPTIQVAPENDKTMDATVSPNPFTDRLSIEINSLGNSSASIQVLDMNGNILLAESANLEDGFNTVTVNTAMLNEGVYFVRISKQDLQLIKRVIRIK